MDIAQMYLWKLHSANKNVDVVWLKQINVLGQFYAITFYFLGGPPQNWKKCQNLSKHI